MFFIEPPLLYVALVALLLVPQPLNTLFVFNMLPWLAALHALSYVQVTLLTLALPLVAPFVLNVTVYVFAFHWAYNVTVAPFVAVRFTTCLFVYFVPLPSALVFQFWNVQPVNVNALAVNATLSSYVRA
jgi:hypothetical protein